MNGETCEQFQVDWESVNDTLNVVLLNMLKVLEEDDD